MTSIYHWNGKYFGFIKNGRLFSAAAKYLGFVTKDGRVWRANGTFLGEIVDKNYILRRTTQVTPTPRAGRTTPPRPAIPARKTDRAPRAVRKGFKDALAEISPKRTAPQKGQII